MKSSSLIPAWPAGWSRHQRSSATLFAATLVLIALLWLGSWPLALLPEPIGSNAADFAGGARVTVELTLIAGAIGLVLGIAAALGKLSPLPPVRWLCAGYIALIRGTPLLIQVLFTYFALPVLVPALRLSDFTSAAVALALNVGAYNAEAMRAGLQAVPRGQIEAARSLGLARRHVFFLVTFPQAFKIALPPLVNNVVALLKDSSLAYAIGVVELTNIGNRIQSATFQPVPILATTAMIYLVLTTVLTQMAGAVEQRFDIEGRRS
jgi:polar amino acid transport system permease protein